MPIDVIELDLVDDTRATPAIGVFNGAPRRELPTTVYLPATSAPSPLIILAHGFDGHPRMFRSLAECWAAAGYVVAVPRFPVSSDEFPLRAEEARGERIADLPRQAEDVNFVINAMRAAGADSASGLAGRIDPDRLGLYGLSLGALTVWSAVARTGWSSSGVGALIQSDGGFPGDLAALVDVTFPVLIAHSDVDPLFPVEKARQEFDTLPSPRFLLVLHDAAHAAVAENNRVTMADDAYRAATTEFWDRYLGGAAESQFPESFTVESVTTFVDGS